MQRIRLLACPFQASRQTSLGPVQLLCNEAEEGKAGISLLLAKTPFIRHLSYLPLLWP